MTDHVHYERLALEKNEITVGNRTIVNETSILVIPMGL